jgi:hypothetical protein
LVDTEKEFTTTQKEIKSFTVEPADLDKRRTSYSDLVDRLKSEVEKYNVSSCSGVWKDSD